MSSIYDFEVLNAQGDTVAMSNYRGRVLLIVNTASQCGFTPQLAGLQDLHQRYADKGLVVLGFPCNQFGGQEPGTQSEIVDFCTTRFGVEFPVMQKIDVNGAKAAPLFNWLTAQAPGFLGSQFIKWNFTKFLVGKAGNVLQRYAPQDTPSRLQADIEEALKA